MRYTCNPIPCYTRNANVYRYDVGESVIPLVFCFISSLFTKTQSFDLRELPTPSRSAQRRKPAILFDSPRIWLEPYSLTLQNIFASAHYFVRRRRRFTISLVALLLLRNPSVSNASLTSATEKLPFPRPPSSFDSPMPKKRFRIFIFCAA